MASMSVLIIEHDTHYIERLSAIFSLHDAQVHIAEEGHLGMTMLNEHQPDLIILAIELPNISGYSICKKLKRHNDYRQIPLFLISSTATAETFTQHSKLKTRAEEYFIKPFEAEDLWLHVEQYVELRQPGSNIGQFDFDQLEFVQPESEQLDLDRSELDEGADEDGQPEPSQLAHEQPDFDGAEFDEPFELGSGHDSSFELVDEPMVGQDVHALKDDALQNDGVIVGRQLVDEADDDQPPVISPFNLGPPQDIEGIQELNDATLQGLSNPSSEPFSDVTSDRDDTVSPDMFEHLDHTEPERSSDQHQAFDDALTRHSNSYSRKPSLQRPEPSYSDHHHTPFTSNSSVPARSHSREIPVRRISQDNIEITILNRKLERRQQDYDALRDEYDLLSNQLRELNKDNDSAARQTLELRRTLTERDRDLQAHQRRLEDADITEEQLRASLQQTLDRCDELTILLDEATHRQEMFQHELNDARQAHKLTGERAQQKIHALRDELTQRREAQQTLQKQLIKKEQALEHLQNDQQRLEQQAQQERTKLRESQQHTHQLEEHLNESGNLLQEAQRELTQQQQAWTQERDQLEAQHLQLTQEHSALRQAHAALFEERDQLQGDLTQQQQEAYTLQEALSAETSALNALQSDRERHNAERQSLLDQLDALQEHLNALQQRHNDEVQVRQNLSANLQVVTQERDALHRESDAAHARIELLQEQLEASSTRAEELQSYFERVHADHQMESAQADAALEEFEDTQQSLKDKHHALSLQHAELQSAYTELKEAHDASLARLASPEIDSNQAPHHAEPPPLAPQPSLHDADTREFDQAEFLEIKEDDLGDLENNPESLQIASEVLDGLTSLDEGDVIDDHVVDEDPLKLQTEEPPTYAPESDDLSIDLDMDDLDDLDDLDEMAMLDIDDEGLLSADEQLLVGDLSDEDVVVDDIVIEE